MASRADSLDGWHLRYQGTNQAYPPAAIPVGPYFRDVVFGGDRFVAVGGTWSGSDAGDSCASTDGTTWANYRVSPFQYGNWHSAAFGDGIFVAGVGEGLSAFQLYSSVDGTNWQGRSSISQPSVYVLQIAHGNGLFIAVLSGTGTNIMTSADGTNWTRRALTPGQSRALGCVAYGSGTNLPPLPPIYPFVGFGSSGPVTELSSATPIACYSTSGIDWTYGSSVGAYVSQVTFGKQIFLAAGRDIITGAGKFLSSQTGANWGLAANWPTALVGVRYAGGLFFAVDLNGAVMASLDGTNWVARPNLPGWPVTFGKGTFVSAHQTELWQSDSALGLSLITKQQLDISGVIGLTYAIDYRDNLDAAFSWINGSPFQLPSSPYQWNDPQPDPNGRRFYRLRLWP